MSKIYKASMDKYTEARGGYSALLSIMCRKCRHEIFLYQKDGPGPLLRLYLDRILAPEDSVNTYRHLKNIADLKELKCPNCERVIAMPIIYKKENRPAFRLFAGAITKSKNFGIFPKN